MFKDFHRRLQRDLKKIVDARVLASEARLGGEIKVSVLVLVLLTDPCGMYMISIVIYIIKRLSISSSFWLPVTTCGGQCSQPPYPEICSVVWRFCSCINT